jgi:mRNA deadenylase 3'-5' endonuclease subunit Ccr4
MWGPSLNVHLNKLGYHLLDAQHTSGKMGVGIAYPRHLYELMEYNVFNPGRSIGEFIIDGYRPNQVYKRASTDNFTNKEMQFVKEFTEGAYRDNRCISIRLKMIHNPSVEFWVSTYHMPCKYDKPTYMHGHLMSFSSHLRSLSKDLPIIFMGDLNITPKDEAYLLLTEKHVPEKLGKILKYSRRPYPFRTLSGDEEYKASDHMSHFKSAHYEVNGNEPKYTNVCIVTERDDFVDTLDYVLYTGNTMMPTECYVDNTLGAYPVESEEPHPTKLCPSDHIPLHSSFVYIGP